jgi:quercetin dioxygenase-like cupin family protein
MGDERQARPDRPAAVPLFHVRIGGELERLRQEPTWRQRGHNPITLIKQPALGVILMLLGHGSKMYEHQAAGPMTLQVLSGSVRFQAAGQTLTLGPGEVVMLESAIEHEVEALEESACLLTMVNPVWHPEKM